MAARRPEIQLIGLNNIVVDREHLQSRDTMHTDYIGEFSESMLNGHVFPPVIVFFDGASYFLADGFHRHAAQVHAAVNDRKFEDIRCEVRRGTRRDAMIYSAGANKIFTIPRDAADKRKSCCMLFNDAEWFDKDAREIAEYVGVRTSDVHSWRLRYCQDNGIATLSVDRRKAKKQKAPRYYTEAEILEREKTAWEMRKAGKSFTAIANELGITRQAASQVIERIAARNRDDLDQDVQKTLYPIHESAPEPMPVKPVDYTLDDFDPLKPLTSALRMMVRGSSIERVQRQSGVPRQTLDPFVEGTGTITLESADKLAIHFGLRLVKA